MPLSRQPLTCALALSAVLFLVAACDSGDPVDTAACGDVAGRYQFTAFDFVPDADEIETVSVRDTLNAAETELRLLDGCELIMTYAFVQGTTEVIDGSFTVTETEVRLRADEDDAAKLAVLYLGRNLAFLRSAPDELSADFEATVDMYALTGRYEGVPPIDGTLRLRLTRP